MGLIKGISGQRSDTTVHFPEICALPTLRCKMWADMYTFGPFLFVWTIEIRMNNFFIGLVYNPFFKNNIDCVDIMISMTAKEDICEAFFFYPLFYSRYQN